MQLPVRDSRGRVRRWSDLGRGGGGRLEYDGEEARAGRDALRSDRRRHDFLQDDGWAMFYATDLDVHRDSAELVRRVGRALARRSRAGGRSWISSRDHLPVITSQCGAPAGGSATAAT